MAAREDERVMISERIAPGMLPRVLNSFDMTIIFLAIVLFIVQASVIQPAGPAAYIYWILGFVTFLIPGAIVTAQLGQMFPQEGSLYVWTQKALGPFWGFFAGFCAWWPGVLVMVATSDLVVTIYQFIDPGALAQPWQQGLVILAVLWFSAALALLRFRITQNYANFAVVVYGAAIFVIGLAGVLWLIGDGHSANSFAASQWKLTTGNWTFYGLVILALLGIEVPLNMGVEIVHMKAIKRYLLYGSVFVMLAYLWATFGNMVTTPLKDNNSTTGVLQAVQTGFWGSHAFAIAVGAVLLWFFVTNTVVYNYSFGRLLFVAGLERRMPRIMGRVNPKTRVPDAVVLAQTALASIITIVAFMHTGVGNLPTQIYLILQASVTVIWCLSMILLFADVWLVRRWFPQKFEEVRVASDRTLYACGAIGICASIMGAIVTFWSPWNPDLFSRGGWIGWLALVVAASAAAAIVIYAISEYVHRREEIPAPTPTG